MNTMVESGDEQVFSRRMMTVFIQISALVLLVWLCVQIAEPFAGIIVWGIILAVAVYPLHARLSARIGGRAKLSSILITVTGLALLIVPSWLVVSSTVSSLQTLRATVASDGLKIPPPNENVAAWPLVGEPLYGAWQDAAEDPKASFAKYRPQIEAASQKALNISTGLMVGVLHFVASIIIAGFFLMIPQQGHALTAAICERVSPGRGVHIADLMTSTIRSVTNGVLGVAAIQAGLAGIGFALIGLPVPGILTLVVLVTAIIQVPAILIMLPLIAWVFSFASTGAATVFAIYAIAVALSDNVLKPLLLGRGVDLPVLVVLVGAIGGMIQFGVIGLFIGAVILGLGYRIISDWIWSGQRAGQTAEDVKPA